MYTIEQTADLLGVKPQTVKQYIINGWLELNDDHIDAAELDRFNLERDPDLPTWEKIKVWLEKTDPLEISEYTKGQLYIALENRVKPGGKRRAPQTARELGVSRERVRYILRLARQYYNEAIISGAYADAGDA